MAKQNSPLTNDNLADLNPQQKTAVTYKEGTMLVVAGAGTGKTQVITRRIAYLIKSGQAKASNIVALTFTEKAAEEMETRVTELLGKYDFDVKITTFNAFGHELLQTYAYEAGLSGNFKLMSRIQQIVFLKEHIDELELNYYAPITNPEGLLSELVSYFSRLKNEHIKSSDYLDYINGLVKSAHSPADTAELEHQRELAQAYYRYQELCLTSNVVDFDDQVYLLVRVLEARPNVLKKVQAQVKYLLIDEFQDTNRLQSRLVDLLAGYNHNVMVVGDDDQSIYRFRGAAIENILSFKNRYPDTAQIALIENYRSSQEILDSAYRLIQHNNPERLEAKYDINKRLSAQFKDKPPRLKTFITYEEEAAWLARDIAKRLKGGESANEIAILLRKNQQAQILQSYLELEGVKYVTIGQSLDLYRQEAVKTVLHFLRVVVNPHDSESLYHLLASEVFNVSPQWLRQAATQAKSRHHNLEVILRDMVQVDDPANELQISQTQTFIDQLDGWRSQLPKLSVGKLAYQFLSDTNYLNMLVGQARDDASVDTKIASLNQFFTSLAEFERIASDDSAVGYVNDLPALLGAGERLALEDLPEVFGQHVRLLTIHRAKGLEFETVYIFDMAQQTFPTRSTADAIIVPSELLPPTASAAQVHLQEERRLMYVAMTRAKRNLILTFSVDHGGARAKKPSIFIEEALGQQPELKSLVQPKAPTDQIEMFSPRSALKKEAPRTFFDREKLILTPHQIEDYLMCPAEFRLRYIISPLQSPSIALEYGTLIHEIIQFYNRLKMQHEPVKLEQLLDQLEASWPQDGFVSPGHRSRALEQAKRSITSFYQREEAANSHPDYIELSFKLLLADVGVQVNGRFDAVYASHSRALEIRDYKTGAASIDSAAKAETRAKNSLQLGIYALAWRELKGKNPDVVTLDFIDNGFIGQTTKTDRQLEAVRDKISKVAAGVRAGDFTPGSSHIFCSHQNYGF